MNYLSLRQLCLRAGDYGIPASASPYKPEWPQYLRITDISDDGRIPSQLPTSINPDNFPNYREYLLNFGDIVFARTGNSTGRNFCLLNKREIVFAGFLIRFQPDPKLTVPGYIGYYCQSQRYKDTISGVASGSTRMQLNAKEYGDFIKIPIYSLQAQQHIVDTIGTIDDLMDKKRLILKYLDDNLNQTFEYFASKQHGPGRPLIEFVYEQIKGDWGSDAFSDGTKECRVIRGTDVAALASHNLSDVPLRFVKPKSIPKQYLQNFDIVIEMSGGGPKQPTGRTYMFNNETFNCPALPSNFCRGIRCKTRGDAFVFLLSLRSLYRRRITYSYELGTTGIKNLNLLKFLQEQRAPWLSPSDYGFLSEKGAQIFNYESKIENEVKELSIEKALLLDRFFSSR